MRKTANYFNYEIGVILQLLILNSSFLQRIKREVSTQIHINISIGAKILSFMFRQLMDDFKVENTEK